MRLLFLVLLIALSGCTKSESKYETLHNDFQFVVNEIRKIQKEKFAQLTYKDIIDQGGDLRTYITASMKSPSKHTDILYNDSPEPWSILIQSEEDETYTIFAYAESDDEFVQHIEIDLSHVD